MSSELVERLRERAESYRMGGPSSEHTAALLDDAAASIEALEAENAQLREALEPFAREADGRKSKGLLGSVIFTQSVLLAARRAREGGNADG